MMSGSPIGFDRDQAGADPAAFRQQDIIGPHRRAGRPWHRPKCPASRNASRKRSGSAKGSRPPPIRNKSSPSAAVEHRRQASPRQFGDARHRPGPDAVRQAQQRAAMRHAGEAEAAIAIGVDRRRSRQMRCVGRRSPWLRACRRLSSRAPSARRARCRRRDRSGSARR